MAGCLVCCCQAFWPQIADSGRHSEGVKRTCGGGWVGGAICNATLNKGQELSRELHVKSRVHRWSWLNCYSKLGYLPNIHMHTHIYICTHTNTHTKQQYIAELRNAIVKNKKIPDVSTKDVSDGCADKVGLPSNGSLVSWTHLFPLILTSFFLLISISILHTRLWLWTVGCWSLCWINNIIKPKVKIFYLFHCKSSP